MLSNNVTLRAEGTVQLGAPMDGSAGFVWDNEGPPQPPQQVKPLQTDLCSPPAVVDLCCRAPRNLQPR